MPLRLFALVELLVVAAIGTREIALRRESWRPSLPHRHTLIRLATIVVLFLALAPRAIFTFTSETTDQDQHVAWAVEIAHQGVVPSHYEGTDAAIDYPLGFHALAASASATIVSPAIVVNVLPLLTSILVVAVICAAVRAVAIGGPPADGSGPAPGLDLLLLEAGCSVALSLALFTGHFSVLTRYVILPRLVGGLCHLVPVLVWASALTGAAPRRTAVPRGVPPRCRSMAMVVSGALVAALNPTLVPLQAVLCARRAADGGRSPAHRLGRRRRGHRGRCRGEPGRGRGRPVSRQACRRPRAAPAARALPPGPPSRLLPPFHRPDLSHRWLPGREP